MGATGIASIFYSYFGYPTTFAYTPNPVNMQISGGKFYLPKPFGPRDAQNKDVFEEAWLNQFPNAVFIDDWSYYHNGFAEIHCGSATNRDGMNEWWDELQEQ